MTTQLQPRAAGRPDGVLARGVLAAADRAVSLARRFPLLADAILAALLLVLSLPPLTELRGSNHLLSAVLLVAVVAPLAWRRRAPFMVCVAITVLSVVAWFTISEETVYLAVLVAFYTVAAHAEVRLIAAAAVLLEAGATLAAANWPFKASHAAWAWLIATGLIAAAGLLGYYVRTARRARDASAAERTERLELEREQAAQLAVAAERSRIARELHDIVAHNIAMMIALSDGAAATAAKSPGQAAALMGDISATGRAALTEMRRLLGVLRQPASAGHSPQPTLADLDDLLAGVRAAGVPTRLVVTGEPFGVPASAQLALYRMVQEALTNSLKHAPGSSALVHLCYRGDEIELEVTDDGPRNAAGQPNDQLPGASTEWTHAGQRVPGGGQGIVGMRERAAVFDGDVTAGPRPGGGWRVHAILRVGAGIAAREDAAAREHATEGRG